MEEWLMEYWFQLISLLIQGGIVKFVWDLYQKYLSKSEARDDGIRSILRSEIIRICIKAEKNGFLPMYDVENLEDLFKSYRTLGGNGAIKELYHSTMQMPHVSKE